MGDTWICSNCGAENTMKFCTKCGTPKPVIETPASEVQPEPVTWDCVCGKTGNTGNFCRECGRSRELGTVIVAAAAAAVEETVEAVVPEMEVPEAEGPQLEIPQTEPLQENTLTLKVAAPPEGPWDCPCGKTGNQGKFCSVCGTPRERGYAPDGIAATVPIEASPESMIKTGMEVPTMGEPEIPQPTPPAETVKKKRTLKPLLIIIGAVIVAAAIVVALIFLLPKKYKVNHYAAEETLEVTEGNYVLSDEDHDISFLYPDDILADRAPEGDYIFGNNKNEYPYVLITRINEPVKVQNYFKEYKQYMKSLYPDLELSDIQEVSVGGKTLYMVQTYIPDDGIDQEQYIEAYDDYYILYTSKGYASGDDNTELYTAIRSLRPSAYAYPLPEVNVHENLIGNYTVAVQDDYELQEYNGAILATKGDSVLFADYLNTDLYGTIIYDREDFLDRVQKDTSFLADFLVEQEITLSEGTVTKINGREFDLYPMDVVLQNGEKAKGELAVCDCNSYVGVYLFCYYLTDHTSSIQQEEAEMFLLSAMVHDDPNTIYYEVKDADSAGLGKFACDSSQMGDVKVDSKSVTITSPDGKQSIILEKMDGTTFLDATDKIAQDLANQHEQSYRYILEDPDTGRYYYQAAEITYETGSGEKHVYRIYGVESKSGNLYCMHYDVVEDEDTWASDRVTELLWSWKIQ